VVISKWIFRPPNQKQAEGEKGDEGQVSSNVDGCVVNGTVRTLARSAHFANVQDIRWEGVENGFVEAL
jgi:hypothetical protein